MKTKKATAKKGINTEYLVIGGIAVAAIGIALLNKDKPIEVVDQDPTETQPAVIPQTPATVTLNQTLVLKKGSKGNEVRRLQALLGVTVDGDFGTITETALKAKKGVTQITLAAYATTATVNAAALKIGDKVMANLSAGTKVMSTIKLANGDIASTGKYATTFDYGSEIGKIVAVSAPTKSNYVVEYSGWFTAYVTTYYWVNATDVKKI